MKVKANKKKKQNKKIPKKSSSILVMDNYHEKKENEKELENEKQELDEKSYKDKLKEIYELIKNEKYEKKPFDIYINNINNKLVNNKYNDILKKIEKITNYTFISPIELLYKFNYEKINKISTEPDKCSICQYNFYSSEENENERSKEEEKSLSEFDTLYKKEIDVILLKNCHDHFFHIECIDLLIGSKQSFKCPNCSLIYGILIGDQPKGSMTAHITSDFHCSGYEKDNTIVIDYNFPSGNNYSGTYRTAFLPDNKEGKEILGLLKVCFDRKLTFTVGTSVTTGRKNTTVWNGVHHKTNLYGGSTNFGYPDNTYFNRVKEELAAKGVIQDNIDEDVIKIGEDLLNNYSGSFND